MRECPDIISHIHNSDPRLPVHLRRDEFAALSKWLNEGGRVFGRDGDALLIGNRRVVAKKRMVPSLKPRRKSGQPSWD